MRTTVTPIQQAAIELIHQQDGRTTGIADVTLRALERKELARSVPGSYALGGRDGVQCRLRWELTPAGQLLVPGVDVTEHQSSVVLKAPALFPTTDEGL